jgi:hypothetical protein
MEIGNVGEKGIFSALTDQELEGLMSLVHLYISLVYSIAVLQGENRG